MLKMASLLHYCMPNNQFHPAFHKHREGIMQLTTIKLLPYHSLSIRAPTVTYGKVWLISFSIPYKLQDTKTLK